MKNEETHFLVCPLKHKNQVSVSYYLLLALTPLQVKTKEVL